MVLPLLSAKSKPQLQAGGVGGGGGGGGGGGSASKAAAPMFVPTSALKAVAPLPVRSGGRKSAVPMRAAPAAAESPPAPSKSQSAPAKGSPAAQGSPAQARRLVEDNLCGVSACVSASPATYAGAGGVVRLHLSGLPSHLSGAAAFPLLHGHILSRTPNSVQLSAGLLPDSPEILSDASPFSAPPSPARLPEGLGGGELPFAAQFAPWGGGGAEQAKAQQTLKQRTLGQARPALESTGDALPDDGGGADYAPTSTPPADPTAAAAAIAEALANAIAAIGEPSAKPQAHYGEEEQEKDGPSLQQHCLHHPSEQQQWQQQQQWHGAGVIRRLR
ncbi:hypothetical protein T492DRAFT_850460 [Pavlovales sp. CCMP2436]|nr:hypothetical protein T492DRAFT_850460 [Pavlovales sp. CCMP2436]